MAIDNFSDWNDLRKFALKDNDLDEIKIENDFHYEINRNNPFVSNEFQVKFKENKNKKLNGKIYLNSEGGNMEELKVNLDNEADKEINLKFQK